MRPTLPLAALIVLLVAAPRAFAGGSNRVYLVPALKQCAGPAACTREFESAYTFDSIVLLTPATKYSSSKKPSLSVDIRGLRDASQALVNGTIVVQVLSGRVSVPTFGTFPDDSTLIQVQPANVTVKNGNARFAYKPPTPAPNGTITNGGGVEVYDPDGHLLAVTGSQSKP